MNKLFAYLSVAAISGTAVLLCVPFAMQAAMPDPAGSIFNPSAFNMYQPGETINEDSSFVALPIKGLRMKDLQGNDEGIMSISPALSYPQDRNWLVFSVTVYNPDHAADTQTPGSATHKIFRYSLSTGQLQRIYRQFGAGNEMTNFGLSGFDGNKLVIGELGWDNSPGPCTNFWKDDSSMAHYALDMRSPWKGTTVYKVPQKLIDQGNAESAACEKQIDVGEYCTENVAAVAKCGDYIQIISALPTGSLGFKKISDGSTLGCTMNPTDQSEQCKSVASSCQPQINCVY
ncbi:MAG: hypothetical protein WC551_05215 [Patescibacteria group bacterium]